MVAVIAPCPLCDDWMLEDDEVVVFAHHYGREDTIAHSMCIDKLASDIELSSTVEEVRSCIDRYYIGNPVGGSLHIVTDDYNYDDCHVLFCLEFAEGHGDPSEPPDPLGAALAKKLLSMSLVDRVASNDHEFCICGHAMSLHSQWSEDGLSGYSRTGVCAVLSCSCRDGHVEVVKP